MQNEYSKLKIFKRIIGILVWVVPSLYLILLLLLNTTVARSYMANRLSEALSEKFGTQVKIESVNVGFLNRVIADNLNMKDQENKDLIHITRVSVKINVFDLLKDKITISSAQLFGIEANAYRTYSDKQPNYQFVLDSLKTDNKEKDSNINLELSSLIIRRGHICYNELDKPETPNHFNTNHLDIDKISGHVLLNTLTNDSINLVVKNISFQERSGANLERLSLSLAGNRKYASISNLVINLPKSEISLPQTSISYDLADKLGDQIIKDLSTSIEANITLCDLAALIPSMKEKDNTVHFASDINIHEGFTKCSGITISLDDIFHATAEGSLNSQKGTISDWTFALNSDKIDIPGLEQVFAGYIPEAHLTETLHEINNTTLSIKGTGKDKDFDITGNLTSSIGKAEVSASKKNGNIDVSIDADKLNLALLSGNEELGLFTGTVTANGHINDDFRILQGTAKCNVSDVDFRSHTYNNIGTEITYIANSNLEVVGSLNDDSGDITFQMQCDLDSHNPHSTMKAKIKNFSPHELNLTDRYPDTSFSGEIDINITGNDISNLQGSMVVSNFDMKDPSGVFNVKSMRAVRLINGEKEKSVLQGDFGNISIEGTFDYSTLAKTIMNTMTRCLPTLGTYADGGKLNNTFRVYSTINNTQILQKLFGIDLTLHEPAHLMANIDDISGKSSVSFDAQHFTYKSNEFANTFLFSTTSSDTLRLRGNIETAGTPNNSVIYLSAKGAENSIESDIEFATKGKQTINGIIHTNTKLFLDNSHNTAARIQILPSMVYVNDSVWYISKSSVEYADKTVSVEKLTIDHADQYLSINGKLSQDDSHSIEIGINDVNISSMLTMAAIKGLNIGGQVTGTAHIRSLDTTPIADANLMIKNCRFELSELGNLSTTLNWSAEDGRLFINGIASHPDNPNTEFDERSRTALEGYINLKEKDIDLSINLNGTSAAFLEKYCHSFLRDTNLKAWGMVNIKGPLKAIDLYGEAVVHGVVGLIPTNTEYTLHQGKVQLLGNDIYVPADTVYDRNGNVGVLSGHIYHSHFKNFTYDLNVDAHDILAFDTKSIDKGPFCGTIFADAHCNIRGGAGQTNIDISGTPKYGSYILYNVQQNDGLSKSEYVHWADRDSLRMNTIVMQDSSEENKHSVSPRGNLYLNISAQATPDFELRLLMNQVTGDYISLRGNGGINARHYNKGSLELFGNYNIESGTYRMTIQNIMKRDFTFQPGSSIAFRGNPNNATLDLKAIYTLNSVSLSDINIGKSFTSNNVRVDCLMNITGTPMQQRVDFALDLPTVSNDAKQMITSLMNSEEETKQQVLYLLTIGRFLNQGNNNSYMSQSRQSQTSLAMQSIISGTVSQQLSELMTGIIGNNNWNLGANISTGDEGFNNAEYEGLLNGRMFNNRLLINGQFGYRDNQNATSSFIGDFDIRYLLRPDGGMAIKIYNQTNDKYFTKSSLNTQGVGMIFKKDFLHWKDLFPWRKRKKK